MISSMKKRNRHMCMTREYDWVYTNTIYLGNGGDGTSRIK